MYFTFSTAYHPQMRRGNALGRVCVCVSVRALTIENLDLDVSFVSLYAGTSSEYK